MQGSPIRPSSRYQVYNGSKYLLSLPLGNVYDNGGDDDDDDDDNNNNDFINVSSKNLAEGIPHFLKNNLKIQNQ